MKNRGFRGLRGISVLVLAAMLTACGGSSYHAVSQAPPSVADRGGRYKVGDPYRINGAWYHPAVNYNYVEEGTASWYGPNFHGKLTANGEVFDEGQLTAAHRTLPMPSMVRVTNLQNGRSVVLRVNDRGPFAHNRILDVSRAGAQALGFERQGTTRVRVEILEQESRLLAQGQDAGHGYFANAGNYRGGGSSVARSAVIGSANVTSIASSAVTATASPILSSAISAALPGFAEPAARVVTSAAMSGVSGTVEVATNTAIGAANNIPPPAPMPAAAPVAAAPQPVAMPPVPVTAPAPVQVASSAAMAPVATSSSANPPIATSMTQTAAASSAAAAVGEPYFVQVGAFSSELNAVKLAVTLRHIAPTHIIPADINGTTLYRLRLGPATDRQEADRILANAVSLGHGSARIVTP